MRLESDNSEDWLSDHQLTLSIVGAIVSALFIAAFAFQLRDKSIDTFFTKLCKIWMILGLLIKLAFLITEVYMILGTDGQKTIFDTKFVI
jgi:hypothetical protein